MTVIHVTRISVAAKKYDPSQPRAPKGDPDGGQWTDQGGAAGAKDQVSDALFASSRELELSFHQDIAARDRHMDLLTNSWKAFGDPGLLDTPEGQEALDWMGENQKKREEIKAKGADAIASALGNKEKFNDIAFDYQANWSSTSNDSGDKQDWLQIVALDRAEASSEIETTSGMETAVRVADSPKHSREQAEKVYDSIYQRTQEYLVSRGIGPEDEVTLYRGLRLPKEYSATISPKDGSVNMRHRPLSSWSLDKKTPEKFMLDANSDQVGVIISAKVKAKHIFSHWSTGFGCADENEVVVNAGGLGQVVAHDMMSYDQIRRYLSSL